MKAFLRHGISPVPHRKVMHKDPRQIRRMFGSLAQRYDLLNRVLSLSLDRRWRKAVVQALEPGPGQRALDLCCGTADLALELLAGGLEVFGADFSHEMLIQASRKAPGLPLVEADALNLSFSDASFDLVTIGFGLRNLADYGAGLRECQRVLRPGGRLAVLEFSVPTGAVFRRVYHLYLKRLVPAVGKALSRRKGAYRYLADTVQAFPDQEALGRLIEDSGFAPTRWVNLTGGIVALHLASKA